jgi:hypothetical protein
MKDGKPKVALEYTCFYLHGSNRWGKRKNPKFLWETSEGKFVGLVYTPWWSKTKLYYSTTWDYHQEDQIQHVNTWRVSRALRWYLVTMFKKMREACQPLATSMI